MMNREELNHSKFTSSERMTQLSQYVQLNMLAFQYLKNKNYKTAMSKFEKCIEIAKDLDDVKHVESLTNHGICQFFCGNFLESYTFLERAREISSRLVENSDNDKSLQFLHLRVLANLSLTALSLNKIIDCKNHFMSCLELIKAPENKSSEKLEMLRELVFIFFKLESLSKYYEANKNIYDNNNVDRIDPNDAVSENSPHQKMVNKALFCLHKTLREGNITPWMTCISEEANKFRKNKDLNGYVFILINQIAAFFCHSGQIHEKLKMNLATLVKCYQEQYNKDLKFKEKTLTSILSDFKNRLDTAVEIYKKIWDMERELLEGNNTLNDENAKREKSKGNKILIKVIFKHALNYLNKNSNENKESGCNVGVGGATNVDANANANANANINQNSSEIKSQIEQALKLLENDDFDCSMIKIFNINSEITKSLKQLIDNIALIRNRVILKYNFLQYKMVILGYTSMAEGMKARYAKSEEFMKSKFLALEIGTEITKIHFNSKGFTKHFYLVNKYQNEYSLVIFKNKNDYLANKGLKPRRVLQMSEIKNVSYGILSDNLKNKLKDNPNTYKDFKSWMFLSLHLKARTIDLYFDTDENLTTWFHGLTYFNNFYNPSPFEIHTISHLFFTKLKLRLMHELKMIAQGSDSEMIQSLTILKQLKNYTQANEFGFQSLAFVKTLLLHKKVLEKKQSNTKILYK